MYIVRLARSLPSKEKHNNNENSILILFSKVWAISFHVFISVLKVFGFGPVGWDPFRPVRAHSAWFGCLGTRSDAFGSSEKMLIEF